jgi:glycine C-acetyltransferase
MVDDSHATGFIGATGRGTHEYCGVMDRVDIITGTFGKGLGGALGGFTAASSVIIKYLRARSRPYIFSSSLPPSIAYANIKVLELLDNPVEMLERSRSNTKYYREGLTALGFNVLEGVHPITPVILGDEDVAREFAKRMREKKVLVIGLYFPVVPKGKARIRTQVSAAHTKEHLDFAIKCFAEVKAEMGI